jgi:thiol-disulfide isomerase/thioredoxin
LRKASVEPRAQDVLSTGPALLLAPLALLAAALATTSKAGPERLTGTWAATAQVKGAAIPFRLALDQAGGTVRAHFFDGARPTNPSAPAQLEGGRLHLVFPSYAASLELTAAPGGALDGTYTRNHVTIPVHAVRAPSEAAAPGRAPSVGGEWIIPLQGEKNERAWRLIVHQSGVRAQASILRVDGDTGTLDGRYTAAGFRLSHFAGERPALLTLSPEGDGRLKLTLDDGDGHRELEALRPAEAKARGAVPADPTRFTGVKDPTAPFAFAFPDLEGRRIANTDPRFRGKVVVVDVMGSWCPNCHDEAPFLETLYRKHRAQGLEVVALDFEQPDQLADPQRLKAFIARYHLSYTVLLAGDTKAVHDKLPQADNLAAWPTTFFIGRDGRVKATHVGFTSPGSGARDVQTRADVEREVERLLAARA